MKPLKQQRPSPKQLNALLSLYNACASNSSACSLLSGQSERETPLLAVSRPGRERELNFHQLTLPMFSQENDQRTQRLAWASGIIGRELSSFTELSMKEAALLIDTLKRALGQKVNPPSRRPRPDRDQAHAYGTAGRHGQSAKEIQLVDDATLELITDLVMQLGWNAERMTAFLRSRVSPVPSGAVRTLAEANRVIWALKNMLRRKEGNSFYRRKES